jgi:hypothetical protein
MTPARPPFCCGNVSRAKTDDRRIISARLHFMRTVGYTLLDHK